MTRLVVLLCAAALLAPAAASADTSRVSEAAGVAVEADPALPWDGAFAGDHILLRPRILGRLSLGAIRYGSPRHGVAWGVFVLAHEMGHYFTRAVPFDTVELFEGRANAWAAVHFCTVASRLGATPLRVRRLAAALPAGWVTCS